MRLKIILIISLAASLGLNGYLITEKQMPVVRARQTAQQEVEAVMKPDERAGYTIRDVSRKSTWYVNYEYTGEPVGFGHFTVVIDDQEGVTILPY